MRNARYLARLARMDTSAPRRSQSPRRHGARALSEHGADTIDGMAVISEVEAPLRPARLIVAGANGEDPR
ncbi:MAG: hypothetical protein RKE49_00070 [Oceanicaulis sp.]